MSRARTRAFVALPPARAFALWLDTSRWPTWIEGFGHVAEPSGDWPAAGAKLVWVSRPKGRGRVTERVAEHVPAARHAVDVFEDKLSGRQTVTFEPVEGGSEVTVELDYALTERGGLRAITSVVFIQPALRSSLERTLRRFATEAAEEAALLTNDT